MKPIAVLPLCLVEMVGIWLLLKGGVLGAQDLIDFVWGMALLFVCGAASFLMLAPFMKVR